MGGTPEYVYRDGQRLTAWMLYVIMLLDADLFRLFGVHVIVSSAIRTYAEQERVFRQRYVTAGNVRGRKVYDTRVWNGVRWYRISAAGTVAVPGTSNHEIQGTKAAVDIRDTGADAGITVASSVRGRWIRQWCRENGLLIASGDGFREGWHFDVPGIVRTPPALPAGGNSRPVPEEDIMNAEQEAKLDKLTADIAWVKDRIGGSLGTTSITDRLRALAPVVDAVRWIKDRVGGSTKTTPSVADELRNARGALHAPSDPEIDEQS